MIHNWKRYILLEYKDLELLINSKDEELSDLLESSINANKIKYKNSRYYNILDTMELKETKNRKVYTEYARKKLPTTQIDENVNLKDFTYFETNQGSKYLIKNSTNQLRRIKSYHANTGGEDTGLHEWRQQSMFVNPEFEKEANSVQFLLGNGFRNIALSKTQDNKIVLLVPKDNMWVPATWGDAYPKFTKNNLDYETKPIAFKYSKKPIIGHYVVDFEIDSSRIIKSWHFGSPVSKIGPLNDEDAKLFRLK